MAFEFGDYAVTRENPVTRVVLRACRWSGDVDRQALRGTIQNSGDALQSAVFTSLDSLGAKLYLLDEPFGLTYSKDNSNRLILSCRLLPVGYGSYGARFAYQESEIPWVLYVSYDDGRTWTLI